MSKYRLVRRLVSCALAMGMLFTHSPVVAFTTTAAPRPALPDFGELSRAAGRLATSVVIGEVAWAGSSLSIADEWIEIWNLGDAPTSLAGWSLRGTGEHGAVIPLSSSSTIPARGVYLISNYASSDVKSALATSVVTDVVTTTVSLSNSALKIELLDATGTVVDTVGTGNAPPTGSVSPLKASMLRNVDTWVHATTSRGFKSGTMDLGTPGFCDGCAAAVSPSIPVPVVAPSTPTSTLFSVSSIPLSTSTSRIANDTKAAMATSSPPTRTGSTTSTSAAHATSNGTSTNMTIVPISIPTTSTSIVASATAPPLPPPPLPPPLPPASPRVMEIEKPRPNYGMLRLNEIVPNPSIGKEWIEIVTLDASQHIDLRGCQVHDANGKILTLGSHTINPEESRYFVAHISSARLNNTSDSVALYDPNGRLLDVMRYDATPRGSSWIRFPDLAGDWQLTSSLTPGAMNVLTSVATATPRELVDDVAALPASSERTSASTPPAKDALDQTISARKVAALEADEMRDILAQERNALRDEMKQIRLQEKADRAAERPAVRETRAAKGTKRAHAISAKPIPSITFDMLTHDEFAGARVRLTGRVGSPPGLLTHAFVLNAPDGRGLLVHSSGKQRLPALGETLVVTGSFRLNDRGIASLRMSSRDAWVRIATSTEMIVPRIVDLLSPSVEDAWSVVRVTGTVMQVNGANIHLDLGDADTTVFVKPVVKYRAKRLESGDVIVVSGLLDSTREATRILPRTTNDLTIVKHAEKSKTNDQRFPTSVPSWAPLGAAGGAVAVTEGAKHWNRRRKMKKLEKRAA